MPTHLEIALAKLEDGNPPPQLSDLPIDVNDVLWGEYRATYGLTLLELGALKNHRIAQSQAPPFQVAPLGL